jgi:hypothetical protein
MLTDFSELKKVRFWAEIYGSREWESHLQIVPPALLLAQVGVDGHVPGGARQAFVLSKHSRKL